MDTGNVSKDTTIMEKKMLVTISDYQRLVGLIEFSAIKYRDTGGVDDLLSNLMGARIVAQEKIPDKIITMNSTVRLRHVPTGEETEVTLVYPHDAKGTDKISVLSSLGAALVGQQEGETITWKSKGRKYTAEIVELVFQPEAAGDYYL